MFRPLAVVLATTTFACAGMSGPILSYQPTPQPLRYTISDQTDVTVSPPGMTMHTNAVTDMTISLTLGSNGAEGREATLTFNEFALDSRGDMGNFNHHGEGMIDQPFSGHLEPEGTLRLVDGPDVPSALLAQFDPVAFVAGMLPPLPPDPNASSWPHRLEVTDRTELAATAIYDGVARFAGDTVVNGTSARIIVSEGSATVEGHGTPGGSPGPVDMNLASDVRTVFVWDAQAGVMLASRTEINASGEMMMQGFAIPLSIEGTTVVDLVR